MSTTLIIIMLSGGVVLLLSMVFKRNARIKELQAQLDHAKKEMTEVEDAVKEIKKLEAEAEKPGTVPPAAPGDSASRLSRLNRM